MQYQMLAPLLRGIIMFLELFSWLIVINAVMSWFVPPNNQIRQLIGRFISPVVSPFRILLQRFNTSGMSIDFSPILAYITIRIVINILNNIYINSLRGMF